MLITPDLLGGEGEKSQMPGSLDSDGQAPLMPGAGSGLAPGLDLASIGEETAQGRHILVVNGFCLLQAEGTHFAPACEASS